MSHPLIFRQSVAVLMPPGIISTEEVLNDRCHCQSSYIFLQVDPIRIVTADLIAIIGPHWHTPSKADSGTAFRQ